ncbi:hypothetical protein A3B21_00175 [Candidatus Uhrbacteria bacterium RIFCSPLOWO2_01_FULL_47_24]|uniref:N-acetyltransferase domain-containing protein n=1 Tax=Candidatus Uhrbacteria bacterium RIFCSPLOWO2_01_FULL_47_24 TaxID=1802401 RepID=A0A1F7UUI6_9BACT|nr:MAG: hypothetical protein A3D58_01550 [Candidatus Uhrbacteria bacterium RIFCSPHIGHO2_02_FULL_46_47]OGL75424.1 MAG: hypothetical protein A3F52_04890 [Candidatus Uhrbacteria bacterium RIFCSPHIGHO2_12_FULL_47_11]OGL81327.1 MAG: hypothetical protein A3B21_00175 [Candidatus Uhrbacteria bacterium RIFCSPLOWO2_01_FULL_47_24]OGL83929.1 MAG: hypothetical protein A3J03_00730 [Candidatus Uhrbacteria bacterium RIFCSPLOWO2_02_FULL_46_25]OGL91613.1 MAG: hypothetical protein A3H11_04860 [Candidatus Uhrbacte
MLLIKEWKCKATNLGRKMLQYARYHLFEERHLVCFAYLLDRPLVQFPISDLLEIHIATPADYKQITRDLFPVLIKEHEYDKRYFLRLGDPRAQCFIAQREGKIIHYTWFFHDATTSPFRKIWSQRRKAKKGDAYIGPVFTHPSARGTLVYSSVLVRILEYARQQGCKRLLLVIDGRRPSAVRFYERFNFVHA